MKEKLPHAFGFVSLSYLLWRWISCAFANLLDDFLVSFQLISDENERQLMLKELLYSTQRSEWSAFFVAAVLAAALIFLLQKISDDQLRKKLLRFSLHGAFALAMFDLLGLILNRFGLFSGWYALLLIPFFIISYLLAETVFKLVNDAQES